MLLILQFFFNFVQIKIIYTLVFKANNDEVMKENMGHKVKTSPPSTVSTSVVPLHRGFQMDSCDYKKDKWIHLDIPFVKKSDIDLENSRQLGQGAFGRVITGIWNGTEVVLKEISSRPGEMNNFVKREVLALLSFSHENVVKLMGVALESNCWYLIEEYFVSDTLRAVLTDEDDKGTYDLTPINLTLYAVQIAKAYFYA